MKEPPKTIQMIFKVKFANLREEVEIKVWCRDYYAITWMSNSNVLQKLVKEEKKQGSKIEIGYDKNGKIMAIQNYPFLKAKEISKKIGKEIKKSTKGKVETL